MKLLIIFSSLLVLLACTKPDKNGTLLGQHYADEVKINVSSLSSGLYLIQIKSDKLVETHQFLKL
jgi:hypothetical protein